MKSLLWIFIILLIIAAIVGGAFLVDRYGSRSTGFYDSAHKTVDTIDGLLGRIDAPKTSALANEEASRLCANAHESTGAGSYTGKVYAYDVDRSTKFRFFSLVRQQDLTLYSAGDLHDGDAILCIRFMGIGTRKICEVSQPESSVAFLSAQAEFTLIAWSSGNLISHAVVDSYDPQCPQRWASLCEIVPCTELDPIFVETWLKQFLVGSAAPGATPQGGSICWTKQVTNFDGSRSQAWESKLDAGIKALLTYDSFVQQVVVYNPQLQTDGYIFLAAKTYLFPRACQ